MQPIRYWWSGPICGLGNRLVAIAAVRACIDERVTVYFPWSNDPSCPGRYEDILETFPNLIPASAAPPDAIPLNTHGWEPLSIYAELSEALKLDLSLANFCKKFVFELRHLPFKADLADGARTWRQNIDEGPLVGVHIRRTDRSEHHRKEFRAFVMRKQGLSRELPLYLSAMYGFAPDSFMRFYENLVLVRSSRRIKQHGAGFWYAVFSDDTNEIRGFEEVAAFAGIDNSRHRITAAVNGGEIESEQTRMRQTGIREAISDLLRLSQCDAIVQNNRASTFSLVASMIGATPILSAKTRYPFWLAIEEATGAAPFDPIFSDR
ncbi:MAG: hypothetical protein AAF936_00780 [Pseudomonadota bacterium]